MAEYSVVMSYRPVNSKYGVIDIEGELTAFAEDELMAVFNQAIENEVQTIILNFKKLEYMTSSGIGLLVTLFLRANRQNKDLYAVGLNSHYQRIFELTRLNENIQVFPSEEEVMEQVGME